MNMKNRITLFLLVLCLLIPATTSAQIRELERSIPEVEGVPSGALIALMDSLMGLPKTDIHSVMVLRHGKVIAEIYPEPFAPEYRHTVYSCSKTFVGAAVGLAISENRLRLTDRVASFFPDQLPDTISANLADMTVRNLLNMTSGVTPDWNMRNGRTNLNKVSAKENATISILPRLKRFLLIDNKKERKSFHDYVDQFKIKCQEDQLMVNLSGGNQQKILVARALMTNCKVLILLEPTRGIDVGAKVQMHQIIHNFAEKGLAVIVVSSDLPEVINLSDRVMVMCNGESMGFLEGDDINEDSIMLKAAGFKDGSAK